MAKRHTVSIKDTVQRLNNILANHVRTKCEDPSEGRQYRYGVAASIEILLHSTNRYGGFRHLEQHEVPPNQKPGVMHVVRGATAETLYPDDSRRKYHLS